MSNTPINQRLKYYFWRYASFPYLLGAPGHPHTDKEGRLTGLAWIPSYVSTFRPVLQLSLKDGQRLWKQLLELQDERDALIEAITLTYDRKLEELLAPHEVTAKKKGK